MATWPNVNNTNISTQNDEIIVYQNGINYVQNLGTFSAAVDQGQWVPTFDYEVNTVVRGSDGKRYISIQESGPNKGGAQDPVSTPLYWFDCTGIFKSRQATQQEALDGADVDAYMPPDLVHAAFNQYGLGGNTATISDIDDKTLASGAYYVTSSTLGDRPFDSGILYVAGMSNDSKAYTLKQIRGISGPPLQYERILYSQSQEFSDWTKTISESDKATTAQAQAGTDDEAYLTSLKGSQLVDTKFGENSLTKNGYQILPGGMIIQWGTHDFSLSTLTFPIVFPNKLLSMSTTDNVSANSIQGVNIDSSNGALLDTYTSTTGSDTAHWIAVGY